MTYAVPSGHGFGFFGFTVKGLGARVRAVHG